MASIEHRILSGGVERWRVRFRHRGVNHAVPFDTESKALAFKHTAEASKDPTRAMRLLVDPDGEVTTPRTVAQQVAHHIEHLTGIEGGTRRKYSKMAAGRIDGTPLGRTLLPELTRDDVAKWINQQTGAPKTIKNVAHGVLSPALDSAVRAGLIVANPAKGVALPKPAEDDDTEVYLEPAQFAFLLSILKPFWRFFVLFLVSTGVRFSEATALRVHDLDLDAVHPITGAPRPSARIRRAWKDTSGGPAKLGPPKTAKSKRTISIPPSLLPELRALVAGKRPSDWLFTNTRGNPIRNGVFHETAWQPMMTSVVDGEKVDGPFVEEYGIRPRPHDLRHTYASWAIRTNTPLPVIQRQMGHESIQVTVDTYGHLIRQDLDALAAAIDMQLLEIPRPEPLQIEAAPEDEAEAG